MHEVALARNLVDIVAEATRGQNASRVRRVIIELGALAHVDPVALGHAFDVASESTPVVRGAELVLETTTATAFCVICGDEFSPESRDRPCPQCQQHQWILLDGEQMRVVECEVEA